MSTAWISCKIEQKWRRNGGGVKISPREKSTLSSAWFELAGWEQKDEKADSVQESSSPVL